MEELVVTMGPNLDHNSREFKENAKKICGKRLGGVWETVPVENLHIKKLTGGMSNFLFHCYLDENHAPLKEEPKQIIMRFYLTTVEAHLLESHIFTILSERKLGPKFHGLLANGRLEEFIPSVILTRLEMISPSIAKQIAKKTCENPPTKGHAFGNKSHHLRHNSSCRPTRPII
ncbi:hypothetical protein niasHS_016618 [Heterodera schachtii]|uniref:Uncharacterized protein n=1 Tax=Heterodera schachtii TaxID=97005 RepID=A0ABD2I147_HETSC